MLVHTVGELSLLLFWLPQQRTAGTFSLQIKRPEAATGKFMASRSN